MSDPLKPGLSLLCKLGSIAVHVEEAMSSKGHNFDVYAMKVLLNDPDVREWLSEMTKQAFVTVKR